MHGTEHHVIHVILVQIAVDNASGALQPAVQNRARERRQNVGRCQVDFRFVKKTQGSLKYIRVVIIHPKHYARKYRDSVLVKTLHNIAILIGVIEVFLTRLHVRFRQALESDEHATTTARGSRCENLVIEPQ